MRLFVSAMLCLAMLFICTAAAVAQEAKPQDKPQDDKEKLALARERYHVGKQHHDAARYEQAAEAYLQAYEFSPIPLFLYNVGQVKRLGGNKSAAVEYYKKYLELEPDGPGSKNARMFVETLEREIAETKQSQEEASPGDESDAVAKESSATVPVAPKPIVAAQSPVDADSTNKPGRTKRIVGLALGGAGLVALGVGIKFGLDARSRSDEISQLDGRWNPDQKSLWDDGEAAERNMLILTGTGLAAVVAGGALYYLGTRDAAAERHPSLSVAPVIGSDFTAVSVAGQF